MPTYSIAGTISGSLSGVVVSAGGDSATSSAGSYTIAAANSGLVYVVPVLAGYTFTPPSYTFTLSGNVTGINFTATASSSPIYSTLFQLRSKNSSGTVQATFSPLAGIGRDIAVEQGEPIWLERELLTYATTNYFVGWKQIVSAKFLDSGHKYIAGAGGYSSLEATLNALPAGGTLEYSIDGGSTWVTCELGKFSRKKQGSKNVGIEAQIELISKAIVSTPLAVS